jgi:hypothetical protein
MTQEINKNKFITQVFFLTEINQVKSYLNVCLSEERNGHSIFLAKPEDFNK